MAYVCKSPQTYQGKSVGTGECVAFVQKATGAPPTKEWTEGDKVKDVCLTLATGTAVATFVNGKYPNHSSGNHAAIFVKGDAKGIDVWDQWRGHPVQRRHILFRYGKGSGSNDASAFSVIK